MSEDEIARVSASSAHKRLDKHDDDATKHLSKHDSDADTARDLRHESNDIVHALGNEQAGMRIRVENMENAYSVITNMSADVKVGNAHMEYFKKWTESHQKADDKAFEGINKRLSGLLKYATSVSIVAAGVGYFAGKI